MGKISGCAVHPTSDRRLRRSARPRLPSKLRDPTAVRALVCRMGPAREISFHFAFVGPGRERRQPEHLADRGEGAAMDRRNAEALERGQVLRDRVALVAYEAITGMLSIELAHQGIARRLGQNRSGSNRHASGVTFDDGLLRYHELAQSTPIDEHVFGHQGKSLQRPTHGKLARPIDVDGVDLLDFRKADAPSDRPLLDLDGEPTAVSRVEFLGIVHSEEPRSRRKYDGGGRNRTRKWAHASFVDTGDAEQAVGPQRGFKA